MAMKSRLRWILSSRPVSNHPRLCRTGYTKRESRCEQRFDGVPGAPGDPLRSAGTLFLRAYWRCWGAAVGNKMNSEDLVRQGVVLNRFGDFHHAARLSEIEGAGRKHKGTLGRVHSLMFLSWRSMNRPQARRNSLRASGQFVAATPIPTARPRETACAIRRDARRAVACPRQDSGPAPSR